MTSRTDPRELSRSRREFNLNAAKWGSMGIRRLDELSEMPPGFVVAASAEIFRNNTMLPAKLRAAPLPFSEESFAYIGSIEADACKGSLCTNIVTRPSLKQGEHAVYAERHANLDTRHDSKLRIELNAFLPDGEGKHRFIDEYARYIESIRQTRGVPFSITLVVSDGWMPSPWQQKPHNDGIGGRRHFLMLAGEGPLLVDPSRSGVPSWKFSQYNISELIEGPIPRMTDLPLGAILQLPPRWGAEWFGDQSRALGAHVATSHAEPPYCNGVRVTSRLDLPAL